MVIAFIPVRGGSKSIPMKNIRDFCGKPLVYWTIKAAVDSDFIDKVVVATDSEKIRQTVFEFSFEKVDIYMRDPDNAQDDSSTESVMLEYIYKNSFRKNDIFVLIQATSPLLTSEDLNGGFQLMKHADSVLSAVRTKRFFWSKSGKSLNYDYNSRPRRQDFSGSLMENGAFYFNSIENIFNTHNRLSGKIAVYEMPEYTSFEIDEPDDWIIMEKLMHRNILSSGKNQSNIKLVLTDVDGVLTDGGMYYSNNGEESKKFNTRDGMAFQLLREHGILTGIITSEYSNIVQNRADKIKSDFLVQGSTSKLDDATKICRNLNISLNEIAFIGDDINDIELLNNVGFAACPSDASNSIKKIIGIHILSAKGGNGVFRELTDLLIDNNMTSPFNTYYNTISNKNNHGESQNESH